MSGPFGSSQWMYSSGGFYPYAIDNSLRFNDDDSAYLTRTPSSAGNRKTWTWSGWVKRGNLGTLQGLFHCYDGAASRRSSIVFNTDNTIGVDQGGSSTSGLVDTVAVFRDTLAWYHIVVRADYSNGTASDRVKIYVNGVLQSVSTSDDFDNADGLINSTNAHELGSFDGSGQFIDGYMADVNFIDGTALDPTSFGETKSGIWIPKKYSGSYGTNGFYLKFAGNPNDSSGNSNNWTANNISSHDYMPDSPTNNFATFNPIDKNDGTYSEGNLKAVTGTVGGSTQRGSFYFNNGKWYYEFLPTSNGGITALGFESLDGGVYTPHFYQADNGQYYNGASASAYGATFTTSDVIGVALDADNRTVQFFKNGTSQGTISSGNSGMTAGDEYVVHLSDRNVLQTLTGVINFGQDSTFAGATTAGGNADDNGVGDFKYAPPSGYLALCTANLPAPAIDPADDDTPEDYFNTVLYTGTGSAQSITGVGFGSAPDFVWIKQRSGTAFHNIYDRLRIVSGDHKRLYTNATNAEESSTYFGATNLSSFDSDGFSVGGGSDTNNSSSTYVAWNWKAGGTAGSNTDGSITSQVSANTEAGFSIVSYTGTGANATVGHGLSSAPEMMIVKARSFGPSAWSVYTAKTGAGNELLLNTTAASASAANVWNNTAPTSSVFTVGTAASTNQNTATYIAYIFHSVENYSKVNSYTGNGSTDGTFVYTGFRPAFVMIKRTNGVTDWMIKDNQRPEYNTAAKSLRPNQSDAEFDNSNHYIDLLSNGFKCKGTDNMINASGDTYIYMAFAEQPFKYANAR